MDDLRYAGVDFCDTANGEGVGVVLFTQGCSHHCQGCHNPETWDFKKGKPFTNDTLLALEKHWKKPFIKRFTLSGGDPFDNLQLSMFLAARFKGVHLHKKLWIYTGYTFKQILDNDDFRNSMLLSLADVIVDGPFDIKQKDLSLAFRGSSNQRLIDVQKSLEMEEAVLYKLNV